MHSKTRDHLEGTLGEIEHTLKLINGRLPSDTLESISGILHEMVEKNWTSDEDILESIEYALESTDEMLYKIEITLEDDMDLIIKELEAILSMFEQDSKYLESTDEMLYEIEEDIDEESDIEEAREVILNTLQDIEL